MSTPVAVGARSAGVKRFIPAESTTKLHPHYSVLALHSSPVPGECWIVDENLAPPFLFRHISIVFDRWLLRRPIESHSGAKTSRRLCVGVFVNL